MLRENFYCGLCKTRTTRVIGSGKVYCKKCEHKLDNNLPFDNEVLCHNCQHIYSLKRYTQCPFCGYIQK